MVEAVPFVPQLEWMNLNFGGTPITTRRIALHRKIAMNEGSLGLSAFALAEYDIPPHQHYSTVQPRRTTEKILTVTGNYNQDGQSLDLTLHRKLQREEIMQALARINLLNEFFSDLGRRFEVGSETLLPLFEGLQAGYRKIDLKTTGVVFVFEQEGARCELASSSVAEMTFLRDGFGNILNL
jgi:hypothetical protein